MHDSPSSGYLHSNHLSIIKESTQILTPRLPLHHIKQRQPTKPPRQRRPYSLIRKRRILPVNLDRLAAPARGRRIRHQLHMAALFQTDEPENGFFDCAADGEQAVVLQEGGFFGAERGGDVVAFFGEDNAVELFV